MSSLKARTDCGSRLKRRTLALDLLSCPHIPNAKRAMLFNDLRADIDLARLPLASAAAAVTAFEESLVRGLARDPTARDDQKEAS